MHFSGFISTSYLLHVLELQPVLHLFAGVIRLLTIEMGYSFYLEEITRTNSFSHMQPRKIECFLWVISDTI